MSVDLPKAPLFCLNELMNSSEIRQKFLEYFSVKGGPASGGKHAIVPSSSLIPDDPSVLLTTAGMQQFKPYYTGKADPIKDFGSQNTASVQKSFRTSDIEEVGDERHLTFFEMLGNFSFGGYFKDEAITFAHEFIAKEMGLEISYITVFRGSDTVPKDEESRRIWNSLGITDVREEGIDDVFWGPTGSSGPCGPTTEIYCKNGVGQDIEVWNIVFNEFVCSGSREDLLAGKATLIPLPQKGIDTGMGLERLAMVSQNTLTIFETDIFAPLIKLIPSEINEVRKRIIADHLRGAVFLLADGVRPSNKQAGYILRRLLRRVLAYEHTQNISPQIFEAILLKAVEQHGPFYPELKKEKDAIVNEYWIEREKFSKMLEAGIKETDKFPKIDAPLAFNLYQSFGISLDIIRDVAGEKAKDVTNEAFEEEFKKHREISRAGQEAKFGGHGLILDTGELKAGNEEELKKVTRLHTATHLMQAALRKILGEEVHQMGSDITAERTRFDFTFPRKVTSEELTQVEDIVNMIVQADYRVEAEEMLYEEAIKTGALHFFREKYPDRVTVYSVVDKASRNMFSHELCGGPHVAHTSEIGKFKILKEESSSAGVRRIRADVE